MVVFCIDEIADGGDTVEDERGHAVRMLESEVEHREYLHLQGAGRLNGFSILL